MFDFVYCSWKQGSKEWSLLPKDWHLSSDFIAPIGVNAHLQALWEKDEQVKQSAEIFALKRTLRAFLAPWGIQL